MWKRAAIAVIVVVASSLATGSCGGGGGGDGSDATVTLPPIYSDGALDGRINYHVPTGSDFIVQANLPPLVGDHDCVGAVDNGYGYRSFLCYPLGSIPAGANVTRATLRVWQTQVTSGGGAHDPYDHLGDLSLHHIALTNGTSLTGPDCTKAPEADMGILSTDASLGVKSRDVTSAVRADLLAGRTYSHFRIQFTVTDSDSDHWCEAVSLSDGEGNGGSDLPELVVTYAP